MTEKDAGRVGISRRSFLASAAAAGVAATTGLSSLTPVALADDAAVEETKVTFCRGNCGANMCQFDVKVREGHVVSMLPRIHPDADPVYKGRSKGCFRGMSMMQTLYNERRVKYPMRRKDGTARGAGEWERITWDEALDEIATKWAGYIKEYGGQSIVRWSIYGSTVTLNGSYGSWPRLCTLLGISKFLPGADQAMMWTVQQNLGQLCVGCDGPSIAEHSKNILIWGANPGECGPQEYRYVQDAQKRGAKTIAIDPRVTVTSSKSDMHIAIRPSTDAVLGMAILKDMIETGQIDWTFQLYYSTAMYLVKATDGKFLRDSDYGIPAVPNGLSNNTTGVQFTDDPAFIWDNNLQKAVHIEEVQNPAFFGTFTVDVNGEEVQCTTALSLLYERVAEWTMDRAAAICGITVEEIKAVEAAILDGPTLFIIPNGLGHTTNSHTVYTAAICLALLSGNFMKPGCGLSYCGPSSTMGWIPVSYYEYTVPPAIPGGRVYAALKFPEIMKTGMYAGQPAPIKSVLIASGNPISNTPDRKAMLDALDKVEFVVCVDPIMTESAMHSDLVLPAAQWLEEEDAAVSMFVAYTPYGEKCVEPTFEHKPDFEIAKALGIKMGFEALYQETFDDVINQMFYTSINPTGIDGIMIDRERLQKEKAIRVTPDGAYDTYFLCQDYRASIYNENPVPINYFGEPIDVKKEALPYWEPPIEGWNVDVDKYPANPLAKKYPLIYMTVHNRYRTHTTTGYNPWLLELQDGPVLHMNAKDAAARGLKDGETVKVFNDRGYVVINLRIDNSIQPGMVDLPHGWQEDQFIEGHYQDLTPSFTHPFDCNDNYYDCLCEVEKYEGSVK